jgi:hypothetical protein
MNKRSSSSATSSTLTSSVSSCRLNKVESEKRVIALRQQQNGQQIIYDSVELTGLTDRQCYIYNRAFRVTVDQLPTTSMEEAARVASAVVIFNMALVLHRINLLRSKAVPAQKALALYQIVLNLTNEPNEGSSGMVGAIKLATLNNIAQLQFEEGQHDLSMNGFCFLGNIVRTITHSPLGPNEMRGIVINILCLKTGPKVAPAA